MKFIDFLKIFDGPGLTAVVYVEQDGDDADPIWTGSLHNTPYWLAEMELSDSKWGEEAISYRSSLGEKYNGKPGIVIAVKESDD